MAAVFGTRANFYTRIVLITAGGIVVILIAAIWIIPNTGYATDIGFTPPQPVPFSHQHHVSGLGLDCRYCHTAVEQSSNAGMPATQICMTCHSQIWTNAALLAPVRDSLANDKPIEWHRVTDLPDYVYFNHSIHIAKGVGCSSCHGAVDRMPLMSKQATFTMGFCTSCHSNPGPNLRPQSEIFNTEWHRTADTPSPAALMKLYHIPDRNLTDCSICHR